MTRETIGNAVMCLTGILLLILIVIIFYCVETDNKRKDWCKAHGFEVFETRTVFCVDDQRRLILPAR